MDKRTLDARRGRVSAVNRFLSVVAGTGRGFFRYADGGVSRFEVDGDGHLWFVDGHRGARIWTHVHGWWGNRFTNGGTMQVLCLALKEFIMTGEPQPLGLGPWPETLCGGDLWGYGDDMEQVRLAADSLGLASRYY